MARGWVWIACGVLLAARGFAQGAPPAAPKLSGAIGVAIDSLHGGPLVGATVQVVGAGREAITDSVGRFRIDSVPPGSYQVALFAPVLDSVGLAVATQPIAFPSGRYAIVRMTTPSPAGLVEKLCPPEKRRTGPAMLLGRVMDADSESTGVEGAKVQLTWGGIDVGKAVGVRRYTIQREAVSEASGVYRICGVPASISGVVRATMWGVATADVPVTFSSDLVQIVSLSIARPAAVVATDTARAPAPAVTGSTAPPAKTRDTAAGPSAPVLRRGTAVVVGRVIDRGSRPVADAEISVSGAAGKATTDSLGRFVLKGQPSGTQALVVKKIAYAPMSVPVELSTRRVDTVLVQMTVAPPTLATVAVEGKREQGLKKIGFSDRQKMGLGHFLTQDQIERNMPQVMSDVFTTMPGLTIDYSSGQPVIKGARQAGGGCVNYYIDGAPYTPQTPGDINDYMQPNELAAVEVYSASEVPGEFTQGGNSSCTTIVIWTKTRVGG